MFSASLQVLTIMDLDFNILSPNTRLRSTILKTIVVLIYSKPLNKKNTPQKLYFSLLILLPPFCVLSLPIYSLIIAGLKFYVNFVDFYASPQDDVLRHSNCVATLSFFIYVLGIVVMLLRHSIYDFAFEIELRLSQPYFDCRDLPFQSCVFNVFRDTALVMYNCRPLD